MDSPEMHFDCVHSFVCYEAAWALCMRQPTNEITTRSPRYIGQWSHPFIKWHSIAAGYKNS
jgi:hypothetical protein